MTLKIFLVFVNSDVNVATKIIFRLISSNDVSCLNGYSCIVFYDKYIDGR